MHVYVEELIGVHFPLFLHGDTAHGPEILLIKKEYLNLHKFTSFHVNSRNFG